MHAATFQQNVDHIDKVNAGDLRFTLVRSRVVAWLFGCLVVGLVD